MTPCYEKKRNLNKTNRTEIDVDKFPKLDVPFDIVGVIKYQMKIKKIFLKYLFLIR